MIANSDAVSNGGAAACSALAERPAPAGARGARLGNHVNKSTTAPEQAFSAAIWRLQRTMWRVTDYKRLAGCHRWTAAGSSGAALQWAGHGRARIGGLQTSGSVWASPLCALKISRARADEVATAAKNWKSTGQKHSLEFLTLTVRHDKTQSLAQVWGAVSAGWRGVTQGAAWRGTARHAGDKAAYGIAHYTRAAEVTHGAHGWHVHLHVLLFLTKQLSEAERKGLSKRIFSRWKNGVVRAGFSAPTSKNGIKLETAITTQDCNALGAYLAKGAVASIGAEIASGQQKRARGKTSRTPFQILEDIATAYEEKRPCAEDFQLWREWETASWGRRQLTWSRGAKKALGVLDLSDAQVMEKDQLEAENGAYSLAVIERDTWSRPAPGTDVALSDDTDTRRLIIEEVGKAKSPVQALKRAEKILDLLGIRYVLNFTPLSPSEKPPLE